MSLSSAKTSPSRRPQFSSPYIIGGTNVGGEIEQGKAIFSDPTDVMIEGKAIKQITVSSTAEPISFTRDNKLRGSGKKTDPALLVPCFQLKDPDYEGWVNKLGGSGLTPKNWRRRWFVLKDCKVYYYKTTFDIQALGIIDLHGYTIEKAHDIKKKNGFKATKPGARTYYFFTDTADEMMRWIDVMTESSEARLDETDDQKQSVTSIRGGSVESCDEIDDDDIK